MNLDGTRFEVGPFCESDRCRVSTVWCNAARGERVLINAESDAAGNWLLRDTGGALPWAARLMPAQQFGRQGQLHSNHNQVCPEAKRIKARRRR